ncbi:hypothetical protein QQS21_007854 [Conoideocrella luteorostrata]|uniref:Flavin-containing amine oxidasedehydrogenase n=1 Tax=Conoideocrella luteorostrata TaxID=1105319 RepID=A0AAJ0FZ54_9HYPO|nr:hypothetical protein QQS21_007854 [Conoideocrella luteorostrata]
MTTPRPRRHIAIVGGGAAGMACAATLGRHPRKFKVSILEKNEVLGGQAGSIPLNEQIYGAPWMNNGVQGGSHIFKHTFKFFEEHGYPPQKVQLQVSFGKGEDGFWTNVFPSTLVQRFARDIKLFGLFLKVVKWMLPIIGLIPISVMLRVFFFDKEFGNKMVYPLIALFLGTGNQTANVPCGIVERLFDDPNMKLWGYDDATLLPNLPTMYTFDNLHRFYRSWGDGLRDHGVEIRTSQEVCRVLSRSRAGVQLRIKNLRSGEFTDEMFDELVLCTLADDSLEILGEQATWRERLVLKGVSFYDDLTVTHSDKEYFERQYETKFRPSLCAEPINDNQKQQISFAQGSESGSQGFRPMYFTYTYDNNPRLIEMSFNCSNYQYQLVAGNSGTNKVEPVYQTIFLNKDERELWTIEEISENKIIKRNWWHQLGHRWQHYLRVVPGMMFLNGRNNTIFAGSWTLVNMHELACVSGIAAAYRLGADYSRFDEFATNFFAKYLLVSHGMLFSREERNRNHRRQ